MAAFIIQRQAQAVMQQEGERKQRDAESGTTASGQQKPKGSDPRKPITG